MQRKIPKEKRLLKKFGGSEIIDGQVDYWSIEVGIRRTKEVGFPSKRSRKRAIESQRQINALYAHLKKGN